RQVKRLLTVRVRVSAVAVCLVFYVGTLSSVWGGLQQNASDSKTERVSAQKQTLLAKVSVSESAESTSSQRTVAWQVVARWALIIGLAAISYFAVYLSSTGPVRTTFPTEPPTSPRQIH